MTWLFLLGLHTILTMKNKTPKPGYYIEKEEGYIYLYLKDENQWVFLSDTSGETNGFPDYETADILKRSKYIGNNLNDLIKHVVNSKFWNKVWLLTHRRVPWLPIKWKPAKHNFLNNFGRMVKWQTLQT